MSNRWYMVRICVRVCRYVSKLNHTHNYVRSKQYLGMIFRKLGSLLLAQCPGLQNPTDGEVTTTSRRLNGHTATYTCNSGYVLMDLTPGSDMRTCQSDRTWSGSEAQCIGLFKRSRTIYDLSPYNIRSSVLNIGVPS